MSPPAPGDDGAAIDASPFAFLPPAPASSGSDGEPDEPPRFRPGTSRNAAAPAAFSPADAPFAFFHAATGAAPVSASEFASAWPRAAPSTSAQRPSTRTRSDNPASLNPIPHPHPLPDPLPSPRASIALNPQGRNTADDDAHFQRIREECENDSDQEDLDNVFAFQPPPLPPDELDDPPPSDAYPVWGVGPDHPAHAQAFADSTSAHPLSSATAGDVYHTFPSSEANPPAATLSIGPQSLRYRTNHAPAEAYSSFAGMVDGDESEMSEVKYDLGKVLPRHSHLHPPMSHMPPAGQPLSFHSIGKRQPQTVLLQDPHAEDSPYVEVQISVQSDDVDESCNTLRVWVIAFTCITISVAANAYWTLRFPSPTLTAPLMVLFAWPTGKAWARHMPKVKIPLPAFLFGPGATVDLNPGEWTMKEHGLLAQMSMVTVNNYTSYPVFMLPSIDNKYFWDHRVKGGAFALGLLISWSSAFVGIGLAGLSQRFLVRAASTIWPYNLTISLLINVLHAEEEPVNGFTRVRYFKFLMFGMAAWQFVPTYLVTTISFFNWVCWTNPHSAAVNHIFGYKNGLALFPISFDWTQISTITSPLVPPWWTSLNLAIAYFIFWVVLGTVLLFTNSLNFGYFPLLGSGVYDKYANSYDVGRVLNGPHGPYSDAKYHAYSPAFLSYGFYLIYGAGLAMPMALLVHFILHYWSAVVGVFKYGRAEKDDIHAKMMFKYPQVPEWVYFCFLPIGFAIGIGAVRGLDTGMPIFSLLVAFAICTIFFLPAGLVFAQTNLFISFTNILADLVAGYMHPGSATVNILFKAFCISVNNIALLYASALKMGHYFKVPPRVSVVAQTLFVLWTYVVQFATKSFLMWKVHDLCNPQQAGGMICLGAQQSYSSSIVWGTIGPQRLFGGSGMYGSLYWWMLGGALLPVPIWLLGKTRPQIEYVSAPVLLLAATFIPTSTPVNVMLFIIPNILTQWVVRHVSFKFWDRYQYITSAALDAGAAIASIIIFLALQLPKDGRIHLRWWGNDVMKDTRDYADVPWKTAPPNGIVV